VIAVAKVPLWTVALGNALNTFISIKAIGGFICARLALWAASHRGITPAATTVGAYPPRTTRVCHAITPIFGAFGLPNCAYLAIHTAMLGIEATFTTLVVEAPFSLTTVRIDKTLDTFPLMAKWVSCWAWLACWATSLGIITVNT
jgi:hypothetical protein